MAFFLGFGLVFVAAKHHAAAIRELFLFANDDDQC
jgi:hypothetical protein